MPKVSRTTLKKSKEITEAVIGKRRGARKNNGTKDDTVSPESVVENLRISFETKRNKTTAAGMKKYLRNKFEFIGLQAGVRRELQKEVMVCCSELHQEELHELLKLLWEESEREYQGFGIDCAAKYIKTLCGRSSEDSLKSISVVKELILTKSWWDTVDMLASKIIGGLVAAHRTSLTSVMDEWIQDEDLWVRRTAIIHQLSYKNKTDKDRLFRYCLLCAHEEDFFIRKAIGWALREYTKTNKTAVKTFVKTNEDKLSSLSKKEALKHC